MAPFRFLKCCFFSLRARPLCTDATPVLRRSVKRLCGCSISDNVSATLIAHMNPPAKTSQDTAMTALNIDDAQIREAAYLLWLDEGQPQGRDQEHWLKAVEALSPAQAEIAAPKKKAARKSPAKAAASAVSKALSKPRATKAKAAAKTEAAPKAKAAPAAKKPRAAKAAKTKAD